MRIFLGILCVMTFNMANVMAIDSTKDKKIELPQDVRLDSGSKVILIQHMNQISDLDPKFPIILQQSCKPKLAKGKIQSLDCKIIDLDYVEKK